MGTRSNNILVVKPGISVPADVAKAFDVAYCGSFPEGHLWLWETNISPLHARHGVLDLMEEVTILGWLTKLPRSDFKLCRYGEAEIDEMGEWEDHQIASVSKQYREELQAYREAVLEITPDDAGQMWSKDEPPHMGWYLANPTRTDLSWRFWNGKCWSIVGLRGITPAEAAEIAKLPECASANKQMWWSDFWPEGLVLNRSCPPAEDGQPELPLVLKVGKVLTTCRARLTAAIEHAAQALGKVSFSKSYADGNWSVTVHSGGRVVLGGYADEFHPAGATLNQLPLDNLVSLVEAAYGELKKKENL